MNSEELKNKLPKVAKIVYRLSDERAMVDQLRKQGRPKGYHLGFECLKDYYSILLGKTTYLYGAPYSGKTYLWFEFLINLSEFYGLKHGVFSVEMGKPHEIYWELIQMKASVNTYNGGILTDDDYSKAVDFIDKYFFIIDPDDIRLTVDEFYNCPDFIRESFGEEIQTLTGDPFNEFSLGANEYKFRDVWLGDQLTLIRKKSNFTNIHTCIVNHARDQSMVKHTVRESKKVFEYYPPPSPRELLGGQEWYRRGLGMICVWRPPEGLPDQYGITALKNEIHIIIQKAKPRGIGKTGTIKLYLDHERHRYYEETTFGNKFSHKIQDDSVAPEWQNDSSLDYVLQNNGQNANSKAPF
jgi:hypothetical protein